MWRYPAGNSKGISPEREGRFAGEWLGRVLDHFFPAGVVAGEALGVALATSMNMLT